MLNALAQNIPWLIGGSADLATSNKTTLKFEGAGEFQAGNYAGRNLHFGVREHAMGASVNGMTVSGIRAFGATFFNFSDYMRASIRLAALMEIPSIFVFTHDSIGVGEDGPTHQPIEQLASLRAMPNLIVLRPGDANEVVEAWKIIAQLQHSPAALVLTRQNLPTLDRTKYAAASGVAKGAYVLADAPGGKPDVILIGTGSELSLCVDAYEKLKVRRRQGARGQHAFVGNLRAAGCRLQRKRAALECDGARFGRNGRDFRLGTLHRHQGPQRRHAPLRRVGAAERSVEVFRIHGRQSSSGSARGDVGKVTAGTAAGNVQYDSREADSYVCVPVIDDIDHPND